MYRVGFRSANLIKMSVVMAAAMLAICLLAFTETTNTAGANSLPKNGKISFSRYGDTYTVEPDGSNLRVLFPGGGGYKWSPDGTEFLFHPGGGDPAIMSADGSNMRNISDATPNEDEDDTYLPYGDYPTWSADGTSVAWSNKRLDIEKAPSSDYDIFMLDLDNLDQTNLRKTPKISESYADFSPDGSQICFTHNNLWVPGGKPWGIYVTDVHGSDRTLLFEDDSPGTCDWSPDGKKIVFNTLGELPTSRKSEVYIINADGSGPTALTNNSASDVDPAWSPDGKKIVFSSDRDGGDFDLYTMDADGSDVAQITNLPGWEQSPDWRPLPWTTVHQPDTGGPSLLLVAGALLFSGSVMFYAGLKRRV